MPAALAAVPSSRFDLSGSKDLFRSKSLHDVTVQHSFAFDNDNTGALRITQLDFDGKYIGYMYLMG
ncbi:hypothetical protein V1504DRAFT_464270 [Lipomyces starkeyi]